MDIRCIVNSIFNSCSYVISHGDGSWLVDCGDVDRILPCIDGCLKGVLLTHAHFDHIYGLNILLALYPDIPIYTTWDGKKALLSDKLNFSKYHEEPFVLESSDNVMLVWNDDRIQLAEDLEARAILTPGHSPDCVTWIVQNAVFTGDSYIPGVKTVTNFPLSDRALATQSESVIKALAVHHTVYPGHASPIDNE